MMGGDRQDLDIPDLGSLDDFEQPPIQRMPDSSNARARQAIARATSFPSREASTEDQLNMKGSTAVLDRFRTLCKTQRYKYVDMLEILIDSYEKK